MPEAEKGREDCLRGRDGKGGRRLEEREPRGLFHPNSAEAREASQICRTLQHVAFLFFFFFFPLQNKEFSYTVGKLEPVGSGGEGGSVMLENPEGCGEDAEEMPCGPGQARLGRGSLFGKGEEAGAGFATFHSSHPPPTALNEQKATLYSTKYTRRAFPQALDCAEWEGQLWRTGLGPPAFDTTPGPFPTP